MNTNKKPRIPLVFIRVHSWFSSAWIRLRAKDTRFKSFFWPWLFALFAFTNPLLAVAAPKPVLVYYMPWFVAKPYSDSWGWHWTMNHFNPDTINAFGERQIASWYYPLIGPYDSADTGVL